MKGSIRFFLGMLIVFGAVGTLDFDPDASLLVQGIVACLGLLLVKSGLDARRG